MRRAKKTVSYRPRKSSRTRKKKKKKIKLKVLLSFMILLLICVLMFMGWRMWFYKPMITLSSSVWGEKLELDAALVFNSDTITSPRDGIVYQEIVEGGEVKNGQVFATIINEEQEKVLKEKIESLRNKLSEFNITENTGGSLNASGGDETLHNSVRALINNYILYRNYKTMAGMNKTIKELDKVMEGYYSTKEQSNKDLEAYQEVKKELSIAETDYEHCKVDLTANLSGLISYNIDNLEQELSYTKFPLESHNWFKQKLNSSVIKDGDKLLDQQDIARVISKDKWWIIVRVPTKNSTEYLNSSSYEITLGETSFNAEYITHVIEKKYIYFYYQINKTPVVLDRYSKVLLVSEQIDCMEVPKEAVELTDDKAYVYIKNGKVYEKVEVKLLKELDDKVLISGPDDNTKILGDISYVRR